MKPWLLDYGCKCEGLPSPKHLNVHWKDWWSWNSNTLATWCEELTYWKRPWCWERLKAGREGDDRGWDGWMASPTQWTWVWASSKSWWWTGRPGMLHSMGSQRVWHNWVTELNQIFVSNFYLLAHVFNPLRFLFASILDSSSCFLSEAIVHQDTELLFHEWWLLMGWGTGPEQFSS